MDRLERYLRLGQRVKGWLDPYSANFIASLSGIQRNNGIVGALGEIGVYAGRLFIILKLTAAPDEKCFAVDVFEDQGLNIDQSGANASRQAFVDNVRSWAGDADISIMQQSSTSLQPADLPSPCRLVSIDGGHTEEITVSDLRLVEAVLHERGVAILDDFFNQSWPGVATGVAKYLLDLSSKLRPFAITPNKVYLARPVAHEFYVSEIWKTHSQGFLKHSELFGSQVSIFGCDLPPISLAKKLRMAIKESPFGPSARRAMAVIRKSRGNIAAPTGLQRQR